MDKLQLKLKADLAKEMAKIAKQRVADASVKQNNQSPDKKVNSKKNSRSTSPERVEKSPSFKGDVSSSPSRKSSLSKSPDNID